MNIKLTIAYDGTNYSGWQRLPDKKTVQGEIEKALSRIADKEILISGASRTDAGVHAKGQVANFDYSGRLPLPRLKNSLNSLLPEDIYISKLEKAGKTFSARFSAKQKTYRYTVRQNKERDVFLNNYNTNCSFKLDIKKMREAVKYLTGTKDFRVFSADEERVKTIRTLKSIKITKKKDMVYLDFTARSFLRRQVRMLSGFLIRIGGGRLDPKITKEIFKGTTGISPVVAPAKGLCLIKIKY